MPHLIDGGLTILQYADKTIFLLKDDIINARNLKFILCIFEQVSGLKINFHESEIYCMGEAVQRSEDYSEVFTCNVGSLPLTYLVIPVDVKRLSSSQWKPLKEKMDKKLSGWKGNLLSIGGRAVLVNACFSSVSLYMLFFLEAPEGVIKRRDQFRSRLLWQEYNGKKKYHLVNWPTVCLPKDSGGLGILDLQDMNKSLLCKWLWKLEKTEGLWQEMLTKKYLQRQILATWDQGGGSYFWQSLMAVNHIFQQCITRVVGNGAKTLFWEDIWLDGMALASKFPRLYHIAYEKQVTVLAVREGGIQNVQFRRTLLGTYFDQWQEFQRRFLEFQFNEEEDRVRWKLCSNGEFSVHSLYTQLRGLNVVHYKKMWDLKIPLKIKIFLWLMLKNSILTKDNLLRRGWTGDEHCHFCAAVETTDHLLFSCSLARLIWQVVVCAFGFVRPPESTTDMLGAWLASQRKLVLCGGVAVVWTINQKHSLL